MKPNWGSRTRLAQHLRLQTRLLQAWLAVWSQSGPQNSPICLFTTKLTKDELQELRDRGEMGATALYLGTDASGTHVLTTDHMGGSTRRNQDP